MIVLRGTGKLMFDVVVIGGGHAGVEAANIASQFQNLNVAIITLPGVGLASAPCNPSVGGVGKGQVVRELDALGGIMGKLADISGIQFRTLNESKGHAVRSTRIQIDKLKYSENAELLMSQYSNLSIIKEEVKNISGENNNFLVETKSSTWNAKKIIFTVGTFLNGKLHTGAVTRAGGRVGCDATDSLVDFFKDINTLTARFKTGTPARLKNTSIDYESLEEQPSDASVSTFHVLHGTNQRFLSQKSCFLTYTNEKTMKIIRENKEKSPMFNGQINAVGARYCPSIEDKAYRYPDKNIHHVFLEPESHELSTVYPSGISSSLPKEVQAEMVNSIPGLEKAEIEEFGYAVEYDVLDTTQLDYTLQLRSKPGVYFAGQVNGTSGYEEAAGQGFIAGANACLSLKEKEPLILSRNDSYIGVMIEDLVSNVRDEPYRLFTARSENRLYIREDNTCLRMFPYRKKLELDNQIDAYLNRFGELFSFWKTFLETTFINPNDRFLMLYDMKVPRRTSLADIIRQQKGLEIKTLQEFFVFIGIKEDQRLVECLAISIKYEGYINKSTIAKERVDRLNKKKLDLDEIFNSENISFECKARIKKIRPETFGQLKQIQGVRQATLTVIASNLK